MAMAQDLNRQTIENFLSEKKGWKVSPESGNEFVYMFNPKNRPWIAIKVFSSINKRTEERRQRGLDAIRVCAVNLKTGRGLVKSKKVLRVPTWRDNLKKAVMEVFHTAWERSNS